MFLNYVIFVTLCLGSSETIAKNIAGCARKVIKEINKNIQVAMDNSMDIDAGPSSSK